MTDYTDIITRLEAAGGADRERNLGWFSSFARKHGQHAQADWMDQYIADRLKALQVEEGK